MRFRLDPLSPTGLSPEETTRVVKTSGAVHTGAKVLSDLADVVIQGTPSDNQALAYDSASERWIPQTISGGGGGGAVDSVNGQTGVVVVDQDDIGDGTTYKQYSATEKTKLAGIETGAQVNNISDVNATDLTDAGDTTLHFHSSDRDRANHTGTQLLSTISDAGTIASKDGAGFDNVTVGTSAPGAPTTGDIWIDTN